MGSPRKEGTCAHASTCVMWGECVRWAQAGVSGSVHVHARCVCMHVCHACKEKRLVRDTPAFQLWLPTSGAGVSDDAVVSTAFPSIYQDVYKKLPASSIIRKEMSIFKTSGGGSKQDKASERLRVRPG